MRVFASAIWFFALLLSISGACAQSNEIAPAPTRYEAYSHGLLWKIEKDGQLASYLFGTVHAEDPAVLALAPEVKAAFKSASAFAMEVLFDEKVAREASQSMFYRDGKKNLKLVVGDALYQRSVAAVKSRGIAEDHVLHMKPWAVMSTLSMPPAKTGLFLDLVLLNAATTDGKERFGLESMKEQTDVFDTMSDADQIELLSRTLDEQASLDEDIANIISAYLARDLAKAAGLTESFLETLTPRVADEFRRRLITERNLTMADRLEPLMARQATFAAVGAMHLPGDKGILAVLAARGYRISRVY